MCAVYIKSTVKDFVICTFHKKLRLFYDLSSAFLPWRRNRFFGPGRIGVFGLIFDRVERVFWCLNTYEEAFKREEGKMNDDNKYLTLILILIWFVDSVNKGQEGKVFKKCINFRFCQVSFSFTWLCFSSCTSAISSSMISALNSARRSRIGLGSVALAMNGCWKINKKSVKYIEIVREIKRCQESKENSNFSGKLQHELIFFAIFCLNYLEQLVNARSLFRIFNQTEFDKITKFFGPFWGSVQERRVGFLDLEEDPHRRHFVIRRLHLSKFDEGDAQGPDVHFVVIRLITERLAKDHLSNTNCHNFS